MFLHGPVQTWWTRYDNLIRKQHLQEVKLSNQGPNGSGGILVKLVENADPYSEWAASSALIDFLIP